MTTIKEAGQTAYEARFADARPREVVPWADQPDDVKAVWARVEIASAARAEAEVARLKSEMEAWKRVAVIAAVPLEAMRASGSYHTFGPTLVASVDEAVVTIRMAISGNVLPPEGNIDAALAPARAALQGGDHD